MTNSPAARLIFAKVIIVVAGCGSLLHQPPSNADPREREALAAVKQYIESVSWNKDGRVQILDLGGEKITDDDVKRVSLLRDLEFLSLIGGSVTDEGLPHLVSLPKLVSLQVSWTLIGDKGIEQLSNITSLKALDIRFTKVTDASVDSLAKLKSLTMLQVEGTKLTDNGIAALKRELPNCAISFENIHDEIRRMSKDGS